MIGPFLDDRRGFLQDVVNPLQAKEETLYVGMPQQTDKKHH